MTKSYPVGLFFLLTNDDGDVVLRKGYVLALHGDELWYCDPRSVIDGRKGPVHRMSYDDGRSYQFFLDILSMEDEAVDIKASRQEVYAR